MTSYTCANDDELPVNRGDIKEVNLTAHALQPALQQFLGSQRYNNKTPIRRQHADILFRFFITSAKDVM